MQKKKTLQASQTYLQQTHKISRKSEKVLKFMFSRWPPGGHFESDFYEKRSLAWSHPK